MIQLLKKYIEKILRCRIYRDSLPRGVDIAYDIHNSSYPRPVSVIFDVGANIGQSVEHFQAAFPGAVIYSFEPVAATFKELSNRVKNQVGVRIYHFGMGAEKGTVLININAAPLFGVDSIVYPYGNGVREEILLHTVDGFCQENNINWIDLLKIDVEGYELEVLKGAQEMLKENRIGFLFMEAELRPSPYHFVPLYDIDAYLKNLGYSLFAIYDQLPDDGRRTTQLCFFNAVYIQDKIGCSPAKASSCH